LAAPVAAAPPPATATAADATTAAKPDPLLAVDGAPGGYSVVPNQGEPVSGNIGLQDQVTPNGQRAHNFYLYLLVPVISFIVLLVLVLLMVVITRFRRAANPEPSRTSHNTLLEVAWTAVPVLILVVFAVPSIRLLAAQYKPAPDNAITLKAIGNQWYWSYEYPDLGDIKITANLLKEKGGAGGPPVAPGERTRTDADGPRLLATDSRVVLPVGVPIRLLTTATDVIHSWAVPAFWIKLDAVPGRINETSFTIEKPGLYFGQCSELCGVRHGFMPIAVEAVPLAVFNRWVVAMGGKLPSAAPAAAATPADATANAAGADGNAATANAAAEATNESGSADNAAPANAD
jgi:cytochrome c oxidase subunit 2